MKQSMFTRMSTGPELRPSHTSALPASHSLAFSSASTSSTWLVGTHTHPPVGLPRYARLESAPCKLPAPSQISPSRNLARTHERVTRAIWRERGPRTSKRCITVSVSAADESGGRFSALVPFLLLPRRWSSFLGEGPPDNPFPCCAGGSC